MSAYAELAAQVAEVNDLLNAVSVLTWDARTQMPPGGAEARGHLLATLSSLAQEKLTGDALQRTLARAEREPLNEREERAVTAVREAVAFWGRIPVALTKELATLKSVAQGVWAETRGAGDFARFAPYLARMVALNRELAEAIGYGAHPYDALLKLYEPDMTAETLQALFAELRGGIAPLLERVRSLPEPRWDFLTRNYPEVAQEVLNRSLAGVLGYDFARGRLDTSAHPFEISFTRQDVRITTRYRRAFLPTSLFGTLHEVGHALYEQGVAPELTRSALTSDLLGLYAVGGASYGLHESQSRLWENHVGRSLAFWRRHFPGLQETFRTQLEGVDAETFHRAVNRVSPSLIRVEADELTYDLHIMLRAELETALLEGSLQAHDLPGAWNEKMADYLGLTPESDAEGVLQDIHWAAGHIGSFPTYTLGNVMAAQFFEAARAQVPGLEEALEVGNYALLRAWLQENVYRHGRTFSPTELLQRSTGRGLEGAPYLRYLRTKYEALYGEE